jgi:hypothetical protein
MGMNISWESPPEIDIALRLVNVYDAVYKINPMPVDFPKISHYTVDRVPAYASVSFNFPIVFLKGTLLLRVPFTIF